MFDAIPRGARCRSLRRAAAASAFASPGIWGDFTLGASPAESPEDRPALARPPAMPGSVPAKAEGTNGVSAAEGIATEAPGTAALAAAVINPGVVVETAPVPPRPAVMPPAIDGAAIVGVATAAVGATTAAVGAATGVAAVVVPTAAAIIPSRKPPIKVPLLDRSPCQPSPGDVNVIP